MQTTSDQSRLQSDIKMEYTGPLAKRLCGNLRESDLLVPHTIANAMHKVPNIPTHAEWKNSDVPLPIHLLTKHNIYSTCSILAENNTSAKIKSEIVGIFTKYYDTFQIH